MEEAIHRHPHSRSCDVPHFLHGNPSGLAELAPQSKGETAEPRAPGRSYPLHAPRRIRRTPSAKDSGGRPALQVHEALSAGRRIWGTQLAGLAAGTYGAACFSENGFRLRTRAPP